jgi:hypothetical protein
MNEKTKIKKSFGHSIIEVWNFFGIWILGTGISGIFQL